jgi:hypothetical protein
MTNANLVIVEKRRGEERREEKRSNLLFFNIAYNTIKYTRYYLPVD